MNLSDFMKNTKTPQEKSSAPDGGLTLNMDAPGVSAKSAETREAQPEAPDQKKKKREKAKPPRQRHGCLWHFVSGFLGLFLTCGIQALDPISGVLSLPWFLLLIAMYALETLVAFLQAYVFTVLSAVYVQIATSAH